MVLYIYICALCAAFSGFLFGYEFGSINGVKDMQGYRQALNLSYMVESEGVNSSQITCSFEDDVETSAIVGLIVSLFSVGGFVGALGGGWLADYVGRKPAMILGASLVGISGIIHASAVTLWMALLSRIPAGVGLGILFLVTPIYIGEITRESVRGRILSVQGVWIAVGFTVGILMNIIVGEWSHGWRITVGIQILAGTVLALGMAAAPRSPRWLVLHGKEKNAMSVLKKIYSTQELAESYLDKIKSSANVLSLREQFKLLRRWSVIHRVIFGIGLFVLGRLTGGNAIWYFSVTIFCKIGLPGFIVSLAIAGALLVAPFISIAVIDKLGRKSLYLCGLGVMAAGYALSAGLILLFDLGNAVSVEEENKVAAYFMLISLCFTTGAFLVTCGSIPWIMMGEIFPLQVKGLVTSICVATFWASLLVLNQVFPILINSSLGVSGLLLLLLAITIIHYLYVLFFSPETKGLTLENIEILYSKPWRERVQVLHYVKCLCFRKVLYKTIPEDCEQETSMSESEQTLDEKKLERDEEDDFLKEEENNMDVVGVDIT